MVVVVVEVVEKRVVVVRQRKAVSDDGGQANGATRRAPTLRTRTPDGHYNLQTSMLPGSNAGIRDGREKKKTSQSSTRRLGRADTHGGHANSDYNK